MTTTQLSLLDQPITGEVRVATEKVVALADRYIKAHNHLMADRVMSFVPGDKSEYIVVTRRFAIEHGLVDA